MMALELKDDKGIEEMGIIVKRQYCEKDIKEDF